MQKTLWNNSCKDWTLRVNQPESLWEMHWGSCRAVCVHFFHKYFEYLLYARHCPNFWTYNMEQNKHRNYYYYFHFSFAFTWEINCTTLLSRCFSIFLLFAGFSPELLCDPQGILCAAPLPPACFLTSTTLRPGRRTHLPTGWALSTVLEAL